MTPADPVGRERELDVLRAAVSALTARKPAVVSVLGPPGSGRTTLLRHTRRFAESAGRIRVLTATATPAESDLPLGVFSQLAAPLDGPQWTEPLWSGRPVTAQACAAVCRGLLACAAERPLLLVIDDVGWADSGSLACLHALVRRIGDTAIGVLTSGTGDEPLCDTAQVVTLEPLTTAAIRELAPDHAEAVSVATEGDPALVRAVLDVTPEPDALAARVGQELGARADRLLGALPAELLRLVRTLAICGQALEFDLTCSLARVRTRSVAAARRELAATGLVTGDPRPKIRHRAIAERVLAAMPGPEREDLRGRAALLAHQTAAPAENVAAILLDAPPAGTPWAVSAFQRAATEARAQGDLPQVARLLERAAREPLPPGERAELVVQEASVLHAITPAAGDRKLLAVARAADVPVATRLTAVELLLNRGDAVSERAAAISLYDWPELTEGERASAVALYWLSDVVDHEHAEPRLPLMPGPSEFSAHPTAAGSEAWRVAVSGTDAGVARELARRSLSDPDHTLLSPKIAACSALMLTEEMAEAETGLNRLLAEADRRAARVSAAMILFTRARLLLRCGRLAEADHDLAEARRRIPEDRWHPVLLPSLVAVQAVTDVHRGHAGRADANLSRIAPAGHDDGLGWIYWLFARGVAYLGLDRPAEAARSFTECGRRARARGWLNPSVLPWRSLAAIAHRKAGTPPGPDDPVAPLLAEELALSRAWGTPATLAQAVLAAGVTGTVPDSLAALTEACELLKASHDPLLYAFALCSHAGALLATGDRTGAVPLIAHAGTLASVHGAGWLSSLITALQRDSGRGLSDVERQVAGLAARGLANPEIADRLGIGRRTVELRLSAVYRKLGIAGRRDLPAALIRPI